MSKDFWKGKPMKQIIFSLMISVLYSSYSFGRTRTQDVLEENLYQHFIETIQSQDSLKINSQHGLVAFDQKLFVDALWDLLDEQRPEAQHALLHLNTFNFNLADKLRVGILRIKHGRALHLPETLVSDILVELTKSEIETRLIYLLAVFENELLRAGHTQIIERAKTHQKYFDIAQDPVEERNVKMISDLFFQTPDSVTYMNGEYAKSVKIFKFCRENRLYPCLMIMKDIYGEVVRNPDGSLWSHKSLASSAQGLPSYTRNGNTPTGVMTIDSVMPLADQTMAFGKNRRLILNFIPRSKDEVLTKALLPESSLKDDWWKPATVSRDIGRNLFRIHGTGKINSDPTVPYFPFMRTAGCIAQRENSYDGVTFNDQRILLDNMMAAMDLEPNYQNEIKLKGILYFIEIDSKHGPVELGDLALLGIE